MKEHGKVIIGVKLNNKEFEQDLEDLKEETEEAGEDSGDDFSDGFEKKGSNKINKILSKILNKMTGIGSGMSSAIVTLTTAIVGAGAGLGTILGLVGLLVAGIMTLAGAFKKVFSENEQLKLEIQFIVYAIRKSLEPAVNFVANVLEYIIKLLIKAIRFTLSLLNFLTGGKLFANVNADEFAESLNNAEESAGGLASNLKDAKKQLTGFDEMNVIQDNAGGGSGGVGSAFTMPELSFDTSFTEFDTFLDDWLRKGEEVRTMLFDMPFEVWTNAFGKWDLAIYGVTETFYGLWEQITGFFEFFKGLIDIIYGLITKDTDLIKQGFTELLDGLWYMIDGLKNFIVGVWDTIVGVGKGAGEVLRGVFEWLIDGAIDLWNKLADRVGNIWNSIKDTVWGKILEIHAFLVSIFAIMGTTLGNAVGGALKGIVNGILETLENKINLFIRGINSAIGVINLIPGVDIGKMSMVKFPRLAKGGIVNNPGPGVMMGSYVAGEKGPEAVLPLTDDTLQRLANMIPITVNVTNSMNGRVISRELQRVQRENDFAFNR